LSTPFWQLHVPRSLYEEMLAQAKAELPNECCGLLAGVCEEDGSQRIGRVLRRYPLVNAAANPKLFESEPYSMFVAIRDMRKHKLEVLAVYHSHPTSEPVPSKTDLERNYSPDVVNLIISLKVAEPVMRGWWLTDRDYREAEWVSVEG
jgi:proteasome lid subunit RPN8/RPN11